MLSPIRTLALWPLLLGLAGCPSTLCQEVEVEIDNPTVSLMPGERQTLDVSVRCSYAPCDGVLTVSTSSLPPGVQLEGMDQPPRTVPDGAAWVWTLSFVSDPLAAPYDGQVQFSARPADGHGFAGKVLEPIGASVHLKVGAVPAAGLLPQARFDFSPASPSVGQPIAFDGNASTGRLAVWRWDFGADGSVEATGPQATYSFGVAGDWPVRLTVVDEAGVVAELTQTLVVGPGAGDGEAVLTLSFAGTGSGGVTFTPAVTACSRDAEPVCSRRFAAGSTVLLRAFAYSGARLAGWGPGCSRTSASGDECDIVMDGNRQIELRID